MKLTELFKSIADTIRNCNPQAEPKIKAIDFPEAIVRACEESEVTGYNIGLTEGKESMIDRSKVIEKTANGNPVYIDDASEIPHTVGVKVVNNRNLVDLDRAITPNFSQGLNKSFNADGTINLRGTLSETYSYYDGYNDIFIPSGTTITISSYFDTNFSEACLGIVLKTKEGKILFQGNTLKNGQSTTVTLTEDITNASIVWRLPGATKGSYIELNNIGCQVEIGSMATEYVPYNSPAVGASVRLSENGTTYTTDENGGFECESISPNMTFTCDDVVDIEVDYWKSWGMQTEYNRFWNCITKNNTRTDYQRAFYNWTDEYLRPPFVIKPTIIQYCFFEMPNFRKLEKQYFDFSIVTSVDGAFRNNPQLETIEDCGLPAINQSGLFIGDTKLETIELIRVNENCTFSSANWSGCKALKNIVFEGVIGQSINFQYSPLLTTKSLLSILKALSKDSTYANGKTVTFNTASKAVIEADTACSEQLALAVSAGWTIAYV